MKCPRCKNKCYSQEMIVVPGKDRITFCEHCLPRATGTPKNKTMTQFENFYWDLPEGSEQADGIGFTKKM